MPARVTRKISFLFFIALSGYCFAVSLFRVVVSELVTINYTGAIISLLCFITFSLQFRCKRKHADLILGCVCLWISLYLVLAIGDDFFDWRRGEDHYSNPTLYFGIWCSFIALMNIMAVVMIRSDSAPYRNNA